MLFQCLFAFTPVGHVLGHKHFKLLAMIEDEQVDKLMADDVLGEGKIEATQCRVERDIAPTGARSPLAVHVAELNASRLDPNAGCPLPDHPADVVGGEGLRLENGCAELLQSFFNKCSHLGAFRLKPAGDENDQPDRGAFHDQAATVLLVNANWWLFVHDH